MKKTLSALIISSIVATSALANEPSSPMYFSVKAGAGQINVESEKTAVFLATPAIGVRINDYLRVEAEYLYRGNGSYSAKGTGYSADWSFDAHSLMTQFYADLPNSTRFTPFVNLGAGVTYAIVKANASVSGISGSASSNETTFTWNAGMGVSSKITDKISIDTLYRYADMGEVLGASVISNDFLIGARYSF